MNDKQNVFRGEAVSGKAKKSTKYGHKNRFNQTYRTPREKTALVNYLLKCL